MVCLCFPLKYIYQTLSIYYVRHLSACNIDKCRKKVFILHNSGSLRTGFNDTRPRSHHRRLDTGTPIGPFGSGKLRTLLGYENDKSVLQQILFFQNLHSVTHLLIEQADFRQISGIVFTRHFRVDKLWRQLKFLPVENGSVTTCPGSMRINRSQDKAERLGSITLHKLLDTFGMIVSVWACTTFGESRYIFEREVSQRFDMPFPGQSNPITQISQISGKRFYIGIDRAMVGITAMMHRIHTCINTMPGRRTHRNRIIRTVELYPLSSQCIYMGSLVVDCSETAYIVIGAVIGYD